MWPSTSVSAVYCAYRAYSTRWLGQRVWKIHGVIGSDGDLVNCGDYVKLQARNHQVCVDVCVWMRACMHVCITCGCTSSLFCVDDVWNSLTDWWQDCMCYERTAVSFFLNQLKMTLGALYSCCRCCVYGTAFGYCEICFRCSWMCRANACKFVTVPVDRRVERESAPSEKLEYKHDFY